jgi:hypothetical protein
MKFVGYDLSCLLLAFAAGSAARLFYPSSLSVLLLQEIVISEVFISNQEQSTTVIPVLL